MTFVSAKHSGKGYSHLDCHQPGQGLLLPRYRLEWVAAETLVQAVSACQRDCMAFNSLIVLQHMGQVYIPLINYILMVLCVAVVASFQTSTKLGRAYGELLPSCHRGFPSTAC